MGIFICAYKLSDSRLSFILLVGATLLMQSLPKIRTADPEPAHSCLGQACGHPLLKRLSGRIYLLLTSSLVISPV
jgi:hypothetical protein